MIDHVATLQARVRADLKSAMLGRKQDEVGALRALIAAIDNAQAVPGKEPGGGLAQQKFGDVSVEVARRSLSNDDLTALLEREISMRRQASEEYSMTGHRDRAEHLSEEAEIISRYVGSDGPATA